MMEEKKRGEEIRVWEKPEGQGQGQRQRQRERDRERERSRFELLQLKLYLPECLTCLANLPLLASVVVYFFGLWVSSSMCVYVASPPIYSSLSRHGESWKARQSQEDSNDR